VTFATRSRSSPKPAHDALRIHVPFAFNKGRSRKMIQVPVAPTDDFTEQGPPNQRIIRVLARAFRWRRMLESGEFSTIRELAAVEGVNDSFLSRILRLTLLAPEIVQSLIEGRARVPSLATLMRSRPSLWANQSTHVAKPRATIPDSIPRARF
jgi:hypothetical protein